MTDRDTGSLVETCEWNAQATSLLFERVLKNKKNIKKIHSVSTDKKKSMRKSSDSPSQRFARRIDRYRFVKAVRAVQLSTMRISRIVCARFRQIFFRGPRWFWIEEFPLYGGKKIMPINGRKNN